MNKNFLKALLALLVGVSIAVVYAKTTDKSTKFVDQPAAKALLETYERIQKEYLTELPPEKLNEVVQGGINGMITSLQSEFSHYDSPMIAEESQNEQNGEYFGIGATLDARPDGKGAVVIQLVSTAPAFLAGIQTNDEIVKVDGKDISALTTSDIASKIRGPKGTTVKLGVARSGASSLINFSIVRDRITLVPVKKGMLPGGIGYVSLDTFAMNKSSSEVEAAINDLKKKGAKKLIFDLRDNGGGFLDQACKIVDLFVDEGPVVYRRDRNSTTLYCHANKGTVWSGPLVVLTNRYSASASEIVAGALQDDKRAKIIGEVSFGKGVGQKVYPLQDGGELALVTFEWLTPNKRGIHKKGVQPDLKVKDSLLTEPVTFSGTGAKPGQTVSVTLEGQKFTAKADKDGRYTFSKPRPRRALPAERTQAVLDLKADTILSKAYSELSKK